MMGPPHDAGGPGLMPVRRRQADRSSTSHARVRVRRRHARFFPFS